MTQNPYDMSGAGAGDFQGAPAAVPEPARASRNSRPRRRSRYRAQMARANVFMGALFIGAAALVYGLALRKGPSRAAAAMDRAVQADVDNAIRRFASDAWLSPRTARPGMRASMLLRSFHEQVRRRQIPLEQLAKDPFEFVPPPPLKPVTTAPAEPAPPAGAVTRAEPTRAEVRERFKKLRLQAVQKGRAGAIAIISNNLVAEGQAIDCFKVVRIGVETVVLEAQGEQYVLRLDNTGGTGGS